MEGDIDYEETFPDLRRCFSEEGIYFYKRQDCKIKLPPEFNSAHNNTGMAIAILDEGQYKGFIGFDCSDELAASLTTKQISDISLSAHMVAIFMLNAKSDKKRAEIKEFTEKSFADANMAGCVIDYHTHEILFANKIAANTLLKNYHAGASCYRELFNRDTPCENCLMEMYRQEGKTMRAEDIPETNKRRYVFITPCSWEEERETYFITHVVLSN